MLLNVDIMNLALKIMAKYRRPNVVVFVVWSALMLVGGWWWVGAESLI